MTANLKTEVKLPKFMLKKFTGDPLEWKRFQETYEAVVGQNESLSEVKKFTYLRGYLLGTTFQAIEGFPLTSEMWKTCLEVIERGMGILS